MAREQTVQKQGIRIKKAHPGFQEKFIRSSADVTFGGGVLSPQPLTSHVLTPHGFVPISDIKVGDMVCGLENTLQTVVHYELQGRKDCIRVTLEDGSTAESALDHRWWVLKDGHEMTAISFELLEAYQRAQESFQPVGISIFRAVGGMIVPVGIKSIEDIGKRETACIGVSNDDELYITDDYLVTKNCGKAQPYNARVLTPKGYTFMGKLKEGDTICSTRGGTQTVLRIYEKGMRDIYRVEFEYGSVECCGEHLWETYDYARDTISVMTTEEIRNKGCGSFSIPCPAPVYFEADDEPHIIEPYTLGRVLGKDWIGSCFLSDNMKYKLGQLGITDTFFIPDRYKFGLLKDRKDILRGYLDEKVENMEKGSTDAVRINVPKTFVQDLAELVHSLGGALKNSGFENEKYIGVHVILPRIDKLYSANMDSVHDSGAITVYRKIKSITRVRRALCRCILVSDPTHLYITNDFVVTHNTYAAILMVAEPSLDPSFRACFTRRNLANLKAGGGILDDFKDCYGDDYIKVTASENPKITFPSGSFIDCIHIANEEPSALMERAKGWQYDCFYMDELTSYQYSTFRIVGTRCRGKAKWTGKLRGTTNPKRSHWTRKLLDWYIGIDGFVRPDRDGVVRYYFQVGDTEDEMVWGDTPEEVYAICKPDIDRKLKGLGGNWDYTNIVRSFTFYAGKMSENTTLVSNNPGYVASVAAVGGARSEQLIEGNFNVDEEEGAAIPIPGKAAQAVFVNDPCTNGDYWITVDLADVGTDNLVAIYWDGFHGEDFMTISNSTPRQNYERIKMFATQHGVPDSHIIYDATHGTYMYDYMPDAKPFISASSPIGLYALMSDRLKDECYLRLVDMINNGRISFAPEVAHAMYRHQNIKEEHTFQAEFLDECAVVRFRETPRGKKKLLTKKEMNAMLGKNRSMDVLDPCAMRLIPVLAYQYGDELRTTEIDRQRSSNSGYGSVDVYDDGTWA